jgi:hypothetical protein
MANGLATTAIRAISSKVAFFMFSVLLVLQKNAAAGFIN